MHPIPRPTHVLTPSAFAAAALSAAVVDLAAFRCARWQAALKPIAPWTGSYFG
jgi:hypothetical protein